MCDAFTFHMPINTTIKTQDTNFLEKYLYQNKIKNKTKIYSSSTLGVFSLLTAMISATMIVGVCSFVYCKIYNSPTDRYLAIEKIILAPISSK